MIRGSLAILPFVIGIAPLAAQTTSGAPQQSSNLLNPNISVIGSLGMNWGDDETLDDSLFYLKEAELAFQAVVDPYARADFFIALSEEGAEIEEGTITWLSLPGGVSLKAGKFRSNFGKLNRIHPQETAFADRPLVAEAFLGEEGLAGVGASVSWMVPIPSFYLNIDLEVTDDFGESPVFGTVGDDDELTPGGGRRDLGLLLRASTYADVSESSNITLGFSTARAVRDEPGELTSTLLNADVTFRWKNPRRAIYRSLVLQAEVLAGRIEIERDRVVTRWGMFASADYQFARRWRIGGRFDLSESPLDDEGRSTGGLAFITFTPSEFSLLSFQSRVVKRPDRETDWAQFVKVTFNIGPHGAHPF